MQVQPAYLVDQVVASLRAMLATPDYRPGARLPSEADLGHQLGVGRSTIREALRVLRHLGLVVSRSGKGTFVAEPVTEPMPWDGLARADAEPLDAYLHVYEFRQPIEVEATRLAATRRTSAQLERLQVAWRACQEAARANDRDLFVDLDLAFHALVAEASGNPWFAAFYQHHGERFRWAARAVSAAGPAWAVADLHDGLLHAIERQDAKAATAEARHTFVDATTRLKQRRVGAA